MSWPDCEKSKRIIKLIEQCELSIYGDEMERWSPTTTATKNLIIFRVNKLLDEIGLSSRKNSLLYEKVRLITHNLGISFFDEGSDSDDTDEDTNEKNLELIEGD